MSRNLCKCHWSRQVSKDMRHCWNKIFFIIIRAMVVINQIILMAPFIYYKSSTCPKKVFPERIFVKWKFRTHRLVTAMSIFLCLLYTVASPIMVKMATDIYGTTRPDQDNLFTVIAKFTLVNDVLCSLLITITHIYYRDRIVQILNLFNETLLRFEQLNADLVDFKIFLALVLKMCLTTYEVTLSLPFLVTASSSLSALSVVAFLFTQYLQGLCSIYTLNIFIFILILLILSLQLEYQLEAERTASTSNDKKMSYLISLQNAVQQLISLFIATFQFGIFLIILLYFVTILCNIYALLDYYATTGHLFRTFITYILSVALELYSLIALAYFCERSQRRVKDLFLLREELHFLKISTPLAVVNTDMLWPQLHEFEILGLFKLNNDFALFLLNYSVSFIVIILEFELNKANK